ncbi:MAG: hypothetical protein QXX99_05855 [Candidatus Bathyarchaeia archaeon]
MGKISKGVKCSVKGCDKEAVRSISAEEVQASGLNIVEGRRAYLCKEHYKEYKRASKRDKNVEKWRKATPY